MLNHVQHDTRNGSQMLNRVQHDCSVAARCRNKFGMTWKDAGTHVQTLSARHPELVSGSGPEMLNRVQHDTRSGCQMLKHVQHDG